MTEHKRQSSYIPQEYFSAVTFARKMIRDGMYAGLACYKAAKYYGVDSAMVSSYLTKLKQRKKQ